MNDRQSYEGHTVKLPGLIEPDTDSPTRGYQQPTYTAPTGGATPAQPYDLPRTAVATAPAYQPRPQTGRSWGGLLVLLGLLMLLSLFGSSLGLPFFSGFLEQTVTDSDSYQGRRLVLNVGRGDVTLVRGDGDTIMIEQTHHGFGWTRDAARRDAESLRPEISQRGDAVELSEPGSSTFRLLGREPYSDYRVILPADAEVRASTGSGSIEGSALAGTLDLSTGSGDVQLREIDGALTVKVGSGSITVAESSLDEVELESGSGNIEIEGVEGQLRAKTGSGSISVTDARDVKLDLSTGSGEIQVRDADSATLALRTNSGSIDFEGSLRDSEVHRATTGSGDLTLRLPDDSNFRLEAETGSGEIGLPRDWSVSGGDDSRAGQIGSGGPTVQLSTGSGNIQLEQE